MKLRIYKSIWNKCCSCGGTGKTRSCSPSLIAALGHSKVSSQYVSMLAQGICVVCEGKGQYETQELVEEHDVGIFKWFKYQLTGQVPNGIKTDRTRRSARQNRGI